MLGNSVNLPLFALFRHTALKKLENLTVVSQELGLLRTSTLYRVDNYSYSPPNSNTKTTAVQTARVASLLRLKPLSFPHPAHIYEKLFAGIA